MSVVQAGMESTAETPLPPPGPAAPGVGASLKAARERTGLSLDDAAQALKLAPRQVKALEDDDFGQLPGRTFARGFVRNYARLLNLDGEGLLARLPDAAQAPALASPLLHSTGTTMGEVPATRVARPSLTRWLAALVLVACIAAAFAYQWYRRANGPTQPAEPPPAPASLQPAKPPASTSQTELANPLSRTPAAEPAPADSRGMPPPAPPAAEADAPSVASAGATDAAGGAATAAADAPVQTEGAQAAAALVLTYRGPSWTEVRDARGQILITRLVPAGSEQQIPGAGPFNLTIGNARAVKLVYRGKEIDLGRYTRQNVARVHLP